MDLSGAICLMTFQKTERIKRGLGEGNMISTLFTLKDLLLYLAHMHTQSSLRGSLIIYNCYTFCTDSFHQQASFLTYCTDL